MRFMMLVKAGKDYEAGKPPSPELMQAVAKLGDELTKAGIMLDTGGLLPSRTGARIRVTKGKIGVIDGPFTETKEVIGGYAVMQVSSYEEAVELGRRFMKMHMDVLGPDYEGELEIRQMYDEPPCK